MAYGPGTILPLSPDQVNYWSSEITRAEQLRDAKLAQWRVSENLQRYEGQCVPGTVNDGSDFADVERKKAGLFYDTPYVTVMPDPEGHPSVAYLHQELLNTVLDEPLMNAKATALKAIQVGLVAIQPAWTKIGYVPTIAEGIDPVSGQPVQTVVHEEFFWSTISARSGLLPVDLRDTDYDRGSPWLGYKFRMPVSQVRRVYQVPEAVEIPAASGEQELYFTDGEVQPVDAHDPFCTGTYLEYKAALVDPAVSHPGLVRCLVLIDGLEQPIKHEDAPWLLDPVTGQFNPRSGFTGFSIHPLALRDLPDSGWVPADSTITAGLTGEVTDFLLQVKKQRQSNQLHNVYDPSQILPEVVARIEAGTAPRDIPCKPGALQLGKDAVMTQIATLASGREHYLGLDIFQSKREKVLGISANTVGAEDEGEKTATEISAVTRNTEARFEQERQRAVGAWYLSGVRKVSALLTRYGDRLAMEILGPQRGQLWVQARNQGLLGRFTYQVQIDGARYMDIEAERRNWLQFYNLTAKDPNTKRTVTLRKLAQAWGLDPNEFVVEQLPEPKPEPPKVTFSISLDQFNPLLPQFPIAVEVARFLGIPISADSVILAQQQAQSLPTAGRNTTTGEAPNDPVEAMSGSTPAPVAGVGPDPKAKTAQEHGGAADTAERINQHQLALTGQRSGPPV